MVPLVDLRAQHQTTAPDVEIAIQRVIRHGVFVRGPEVEAFEEEWAIYCGVDHAVAVGSGTAALHLALLAADVTSRDRVWTPPLNFPAAYLMAKQVTGNVFLGNEPGEDASVWIPVHLYGSPSPIPISLTVIEDSCQGHGLPVRGDVACFSFYPSKILGCYGDGGALVTNNEGIAWQARQWRDAHGNGPGFNYRMDEIQAAILRAKLPYLDEWIAARRERAAAYCDLLGLEYNPESVYCYFVIRHPDRDRLADLLRARGIETAVHYRETLDGKPTDVLSLPLYPELPMREVERIARTVEVYG